MEPVRIASVITIQDSSQIGTARRAAQELGRRIALSEEQIGRAEIVTVELANNILHHTRFNPSAAPGQIFLTSTPAATALQIVASDKGPGMADINRCLEDGFSTGTTPGLGLGAGNRLSQQFDIYSVPGKGTVVSAIVGPSAQRESRHSLYPTAILSAPIPGEILNGDSWILAQQPDCDLFLLVDGLGHGLFASESAAVATDTFQRITAEDVSHSPSEMLHLIHAPMRATRGAAIAIVAIDRTRRKATCCGVGNISASLHAPDGRSQSLVSHNGTIGYQMPRVQEFAYTYTPGTLLVMHSDGIATHWNFAKYNNLHSHSPATIAGVLYRDAWRGRDDATVLVSCLD